MPRTEVFRPEDTRAPGRYIITFPERPGKYILVNQYQHGVYTWQSSECHKAKSHCVLFPEDPFSTYKQLRKHILKTYLYA